MTQLLLKHRKGLGVASFLTALLATAAPSFATGTATYDISGVTSGITNDLGVDIPIILGIVAGVFVVGLALKMVRKFVKA